MARSSGRTLGARRWTLLVVELGALALLAALLPGTSGGAGTFRVPSAAKIHISYDGACTGLTLNTAITEPETITTTQRKPINVAGMISGCVGTLTDPGTVQIDGELFDYANVATYTTAGVLPNQTLPFNLAVRTDNMQIPAGAADFPLNSAACPVSQCFIYVGGERMQYDTRTATSFHIIPPRATPLATHPTDSYVRAEGKLVLVGRRQPTHNSGGAGLGATDDQPHSVSTAVGDPMTNLTCRGRFTRTLVAGNDPVNLRYRCYTHLITAWPDIDYGAAPYTSPADPSTGPVLALTPMLFHGTANGTLNETTGILTLNTEVFGLTCIPYVAGHLWVKITQVIQLDKTAGPPDDSGTFSIFAYDNGQCAGSQIAILGNEPNATYIETDGPPPAVPTYDTDKDGCTDYRELGPLASNGEAGRRDPFNPFDYSDINHDGSVSVTSDLLQIAQVRALGARYVDYKDRGLLALDAVDGIDDPANVLDGNGPSGWNRQGPNGSIDVPADLLGAAQQIGQLCTHAAHPVFVPYGAHPTTLTATISSLATPNFLINVGTTAGFPSPVGSLLVVDSETLIYNQAACGAINTATQFCITFRSAPAQHNPLATVYERAMTTLSAKLTAAATPNFMINVGSTGGFASSGQLLIDSETFSYNQSPASCPGINAAAQLCITSRSAPAQHAMGAIVYLK